MALCIQPCCPAAQNSGWFQFLCAALLGGRPMNLASPIAWNFQCSPDFTFTASHSELRTSNRNSPATGYLCLAERELTWVDLLGGPHSLCSLGQSRSVPPGADLSPAFCVILSLQGLFLLFHIYMLCLFLSHCPFSLKTYISIGNNNHRLNICLEFLHQRNVNLCF